MKGLGHEGTVLVCGESYGEKGEKRRGSDTQCKRVLLVRTPPGKKKRDNSRSKWSTPPLGPCASTWLFSCSKSASTAAVGWSFGSTTTRRPALSQEGGDLLLLFVVELEVGDFYCRVVKQRGSVCCMLSLQVSIGDFVQRHDFWPSRPLCEKNLPYPTLWTWGRIGRF